MAFPPKTVLPAILAFCFVTSSALTGLQSDTNTAQFDELAQRAEDALEKRPQEAAKLYQQALVLRPSWAQGWLYLGATLLDLNRPGEARDALKKGAELEPGLGTAWAYLGLAEYQNGDYQNALLHILKGESLGLADRPDFVASVHYHAALIDLRVSDPASALTQLRPLVRAGVESPQTIQALGISALGLSTLPEALTAQQRPLAELAGNATWAFLGEHAETAKPLFEQLVQNYATSPGVHYMDGVFLIDRDPQAAAQQFRAELKLTPQHVLARVQLSLLQIQAGNFDDAIKLAREAVKLQPTDALCQVTLGRSLLAKGSTPDAIVALQEAERLAPNAARTHFYLQLAYQRAGRAADAHREKLTFNKLRAEQEPVTIPNDGTRK